LNFIYNFFSHISDLWGICQRTKIHLVWCDLNLYYIVSTLVWPWLILHCLQLGVTLTCTTLSPPWCDLNLYYIVSTLVWPWLYTTLSPPWCDLNLYCIVSTLVWPWLMLHCLHQVILVI